MFWLIVALVGVALVVVVAAAGSGWAGRVFYRPQHLARLGETEQVPGGEYCWDHSVRVTEAEGKPPWEIVVQGGGGWLSGPALPLDDSGAGSSSAPAPVHIHNGSCADDRCWDGGPGRKADPPWFNGQLGPRARAVLERYERIHAEKWGPVTA